MIDRGLELKLVGSNSIQGTRFPLCTSVPITPTYGMVGWGGTINKRWLAEVEVDGVVLQITQLKK